MRANPSEVPKPIHDGARIAVLRVPPRWRRAGRVAVAWVARLLMVTVLPHGLAWPADAPAPPVPARAALGSAGASSPARKPLTIERLFASPALSGTVPRQLKVSPDGLRVSFLHGRTDDRLQLDLWAYSVADQTTRLLVDSKSLQPTETLSDAERARRERARTAGQRGIVDYQWSPDGRKLLFPLGDALYLVDLEAPPGTAPRTLVNDGPVIDPKVSPRGGYVSFVRDQNLYVVSLASGERRQLTADGAGTLHNAEAEFVAQEEMNQFTGYWWAPDDSAIAYKQFDEAPVAVSRRTEIYGDRIETIEQRYPYAGGANVTLRLGLVAPAGGPTRWIDLTAGMEPGADFPDRSDFYLPRVDWTATAASLSLQRESRNQKRLDLLMVDTATLQSRVLLTETAPTWIKLHDDLHFLQRQGGFVWSTERSGTKHLVRMADDGRLLHAITAGEWRVDELLAVDEEAGLVYFTSNKDRVADQQLYAARLDGSEAHRVRRITTADGWHKPEFARGAARVQWFVDTWSDATTPRQTSVHAPDGRRLAWIEENRLDADHPAWPYRQLLTAPQHGVLRSDDGQALHYRLRKPAGFTATRRLPVVVVVYGGPDAQVVSSGWDFGFEHYLQQQGYAVFSLDNRGASRQGRRFEDAIYRRLGDVEVRDQQTGLRWLRQQGWVDPQRIGVFGWSYGGYMSLMLSSQPASALAAAVSVAPVADWRLYDTFYTERFLGLPSDNAAGYEASAVFPGLGGLRTPLLLMHGMADDNVLFTNTTRLMEALQTQGTSFRLMTYPGGKHGLNTPAMSTHAFRQIADFFDEKLKRAARP